MGEGNEGTGRNVYLYINIYYMRYKNNVLDKLVQLETAVNRVNIQVNRGGTQDSVNESIEILKEQIEQIREMVSIEPDDFENQFAPK